MEFSGKMPELPQFGEVGVGKPRLSVISVVSQPDRRDIPDIVGKVNCRGG